MEIKGWEKTSLLDWEGKVASVLFVGGCNLRCPYCQNKDLVLRPHTLPSLKEEEIFSWLRELKGIIDGVVITGGEPLLKPGLFSFLERLKKGGWEVKLDTNGTKALFLKELIERKLIDYVAMDLKCPLREDIYKKVCGVGGEKVKGLLKETEESLNLLLKGEVDYEFRTTLVPTFHSPEGVKEMAQRIRGAKRYILQNFSNRTPLDPRMEKLVPFSEEEMERFVQLAKRWVKGVRWR